MRRLSTWLMLSLAAAVLVAGCGSSSSNSTGTSQSSPTSDTTKSSPSTTTTGSTASTSSTPTTNKGGIKNPTIRKLAERTCRTQIQADLALTDVERGKLEKLCRKAGDGIAAAREVAKQLCTEIIKHSAAPGSPDTPARKQALAGCKSAK